MGMAMIPKMRDYEIRNGKVTDIDCPNCGEQRLMRYNGISCRDCQETVDVQTEPHVYIKDSDGLVFNDMPLSEFRKTYDYIDV